MSIFEEYKEFMEFRKAKEAYNEMQKTLQKEPIKETEPVEETEPVKETEPVEETELVEKVDEVDYQAQIEDLNHKIAELTNQLKTAQSANRKAPIVEEASVDLIDDFFKGIF